MGPYLNKLKEWLGDVYEDEVRNLDTKDTEGTEDYRLSFESAGFQDIVDIDDWDVIQNVPQSVSHSQARTVLFHFSLTRCTIV